MNYITELPSPMYCISEWPPNARFFSQEYLPTLYSHKNLCPRYIYTRISVHAIPTQETLPKLYLDNNLSQSHIYKILCPHLIYKKILAHAEITKNLCHRSIYTRISVHPIVKSSFRFIVILYNFFTEPDWFSPKL